MRILYSGHYFVLNYFSSSDRSTGNSGSNSSRTRLLSQPPLLLAHRRRNEYQFSFSLSVIVYNCHSAVKVIRTVKLGQSHQRNVRRVFRSKLGIYVPEISNIVAPRTILFSKEVSAVSLFLNFCKIQNCSNRISGLHSRGEKKNFNRRMH